MNISIILYIFIIILTTILFVSYIVLQKIKSYIAMKTDEFIEQIQTQQQNKIETLEKKLESYYLSIKLDKLCFIGIGGGGCNIVEDISQIDKWHKFIHINSDKQALALKKSKYKILLGYDTKQGLGCGGLPQCGSNLLDNISKKRIYTLTESFNSLYVIVTLGGGVGSGVTVEIVEYLSSLNKKVTLFVTMPFSFEGKKRVSVATNALEKIKKINSNVIVLENDDLLTNSTEDSLGIRETFKRSSQIIYKEIINNVTQL